MKIKLLHLIWILLLTSCVKLGLYDSDNPNPCPNGPQNVYHPLSDSNMVWFSPFAKTDTFHYILSNGQMWNFVYQSVIQSWYKSTYVSYPCNDTSNYEFLHGTFFRQGATNDLMVIQLNKNVVNHAINTMYITYRGYEYSFLTAPNGYNWQQVDTITIQGTKYYNLFYIDGYDQNQNTNNHNLLYSKKYGIVKWTMGTQVWELKR